jgi:hypothetical protein
MSQGLETTTMAKNIFEEPRTNLQLGFDGQHVSDPVNLEVVLMGKP